MWSAMGDEWSSVGNLVAIWRAGDSGGVSRKEILGTQSNDQRIGPTAAVQIRCRLQIPSESPAL
jgi:hypothetical protein